MGRLSGFQEALTALLQSLGLSLPSWLGPALAGFVVLLALPNLMRNARVGKARRLMSTLSDLPPDQRKARHAEILELTGGHPVSLVAITEEALRRNQTELARQALTQLRQTKKRPRDLKRLVTKLEGDRPRLADGEIAAIENLLAQDLPEVARVRIAAARERWPDNTELIELERSIEAQRQDG